MGKLFIYIYINNHNNHICTKKFFWNFEVIRMKSTPVMDDIRKINLVAAFRGVERSTSTKSRPCAPSVFFSNKRSPTKYCLIALIFFTKLLQTLKNKIAPSLFPSLNFLRLFWAPNEEKHGFLFQFKHYLLIIDFYWGSLARRHR